MLHLFLDQLGGRVMALEPQKFTLIKLNEKFVDSWPANLFFFEKSKKIKKI